MKKLTMVLAICAMSTLLISSAYAQTATQSFKLAVNSIYKIATVGTVPDLTITTATPGSDPTPVTDNSTTYSITHNNKDNGAKITAGIAPALPSGYTLTIDLDSKGAQDISTATKDVVANVAAGAFTGKTIAYSFSALATAGPLSAVTEVVTLTVVGL
jgi:hypothetical protein